MSAEESKGGFIQFPLCTLAIRVEFPRIVGYCIGFGVCRFMESLEDGNRGDEETLFERAERTVGFRGWTVEVAQREYKLALDHLEIFESKNHKTAFVRIPTAYAIEMQAGEWSENEARVFIAIASAIGQKPYTRLGWEVISWRANGHLKVTYDPSPLTRAQVDYAATQLVGRGLLACFTLNRGRRFWSFPAKCSREQMARFVLAARLKKQGMLGESDHNLTARITAELTDGTAESAR